MSTQPGSTDENSKPLLTVGIIADTHIPDRVRALHPLILPTFREARVSQIFHAGDISTRDVLEALREVAPVTAVRGNRDFLAGRLGLVEELELGGVHLALMHGHGGLFPYLWDKWKYWVYGYRLDRYLHRLLYTSNNAQVVVFGHTHHPETIWKGTRLLFNPGSASFGPALGKPPTVGLLRIYPGQVVKAVTLPLFGYTIRSRKWEKKIEV